MHFEHFSEAVIPRAQWLRRVAKSAWLAMAIVAVALAIGILCYHILGNLGWTDALLEASMILGGMGPVATMQGEAVKLFASVYALISGLVLVTATSIILAPWLHRLLHQFHRPVHEKFHVHPPAHLSTLPQQTPPPPPTSTKDPAPVSSPFFHYNSIFDAQGIMHKHAVANLKPMPGYLTNFLGVRIDPKFYPPLLANRGGEVEGIPIPANWHADIAEWAAALRAVDLATNKFTIIELGCGWGCWLNNAGAAARNAGLKVQLVGIEGDEGHIGFARECCAVNGFSQDQVMLYHGIAAAKSGFALFPRQQQAGMDWGLEPVFGASDAQIKEALDRGTHDKLPMIALADIAKPLGRVDLLHIDIQGGEADLINACLPMLKQYVAYILVGTHSREIEGRIFETLLSDGWILEIERPAILNVGAKPIVTVDGVQGWRNPALLP